ncbi:TOG array regulator of axonemal microtubules protein 1 [Pelodytes ibericus]
MEIHISRVASFNSNGDNNVAQMHKGSARRQSRTRDSSFCVLESETSGQRRDSQVRPYSQNQNSSMGKIGQSHDKPSIDNGSILGGVIPQELQSRLHDLEDYKSRTHAVEQLKFLVANHDFSTITYSNVVGLITFLCPLLEDNNFTVVLGTLEILHCVVKNLGEGAQEFVRLIISSTIKLLGDSKISIKQEYMKIYMQLMKVTGPYKVLTILLDNLEHKNSRVREEVLNVCIISLLTYPSDDFDLPHLAGELASFLIDGKRKVRHAALEVFAVLAATMSPIKSSLLNAVDEVELQDNCDGLMNAVMARLARKTLPRINPQGLVEYALPFPSSGIRHLPGADTDWLLTGSRIQSGQYVPCDLCSRNTIPHIDPVSRRMLSAGKGKNKFPWETQYLGTMEPFPGNQTSVVLASDQIPPLYDRKHIPVLKTPAAKTKNSSAPRSPNNVSVNPDRHTTSTVDDETPVPQKAAMVRVPSARKDLNRSKPVPPIAKGAKSLPDISNLSTSQIRNNQQIPDVSSEEENLALDLQNLSTKQEDEHEEMISSLRHLRNSAAKKRAQISGSLSDLDSPDSLKLELTLDSPTSPVNRAYTESGVYSRESVRSPRPPTPNIKITLQVSALPKRKPHPPRLPSAQCKDASKKAELSNEGMAASDKPVRIIGQRMNYRNGATDAEENQVKSVSTTPARHQSTDHQKPIKPLRGITGSSSSFQHSGISDYNLTSSIGEDSVAIIGKGVFETPLAPSQTSSQPSFSPTADPNNLKQSIQPPSGIYGRAVQHGNIDSEVKVTMSKSARDKMRQMQENGLKERSEYKDPESKEQLGHTDPNPFLTETRTLKSNSADIFDISPPSLKRTTSLKKTSAHKSPGKEKQPSASHSSETIDPAGLKELTRPEGSVSEAFKLLADDEWERKVEGLHLVRSLTVFHSDLVIERLPDLKVTVIKEVKNLRSSVSRAAIVCLGDMFTHLKKNMDYELDNSVRVLLHKSGEPNTFIREDIDKTLDAMVQNVTPVRALIALLNGGLSHLNNAVKKCTAQHLCDLVVLMGPGRVLSGVKDITDRAVPAIGKFAQDGAQETRYYGQKMLHFLMSHPDFDKVLKKHILPKDLPYITDLITNLRLKGVGKIPSATTAQGRRSHFGSISSLCTSSMSQNAHTGAERLCFIVSQCAILQYPAPSMLPPITFINCIYSLDNKLVTKHYRNEVQPWRFFYRQQEILNGVSVFAERTGHTLWTGAEGV